MQDAAVAVSTPCTWGKMAAVQQLPLSLRNYISMFILQMHYTCHRVRREEPGLDDTVSLLDESTRSKLHEEILNFWDLTEELTLGLTYVLDRYLPFAVASFRMSLSQKTVHTLTKPCDRPYAFCMRAGDRPCIDD